jgi:hypothetical protein
LGEIWFQESQVLKDFRFVPGTGYKKLEWEFAMITEVTVTSYGVTDLKRNILALGQSSKERDPRLIGKHGDGLKSALCAFVRNGLSVEILNGYERWYFGQDGSAQMLYLVQRRQRKAPNPFTIILRGSPEILNPLRQDIRTRFMDLSKPNVLKVRAFPYTSP